MNAVGTKHPRSMCRNESAVMTFLTTEPVPKEPAVGKELVYQQRYVLTYSRFITNSDKDLLQVPGTIVIGCRTDLARYSAVTRYVLWEYGVKNYFG